MAKRKSRRKTGSEPLRDENGAVRAEFVDRVRQAIEAADAGALTDLVGDLHEADLGALLEALEPAFGSGCRSWDW